MNPPRFTVRGRFACLGQDYFVSLVQVSFGWPKGSSLGWPKKNLRQVSLVWPKGSQDDILGDFVSLGQVSFGWPKQSQAKNFKNGQNWPKNGLAKLQLFVFEVIFRIFLGQPKIFLVLT